MRRPSSDLPSRAPRIRWGRVLFQDTSTGQYVVGIGRRNVLATYAGVIAPGVRVEVEFDPVGNQGRIRA